MSNLLCFRMGFGTTGVCVSASTDGKIHLQPHGLTRSASARGNQSSGEEIVLTVEDTRKLAADMRAMALAATDWQEKEGDHGTP